MSLHGFHFKVLIAIVFAVVRIIFSVSCFFLWFYTFFVIFLVFLCVYCPCGFTFVLVMRCQFIWFICLFHVNFCCLLFLYVKKYGIKVRAKKWKESHNILVKISCIYEFLHFVHKGKCWIRDFYQLIYLWVLPGVCGLSVLKHESVKGACDKCWLTVRFVYFHLGSYECSVWRYHVHCFDDHV